MKGYVALTTVLVMIPLLLLTGIDSVYNNLTSLIVGRMNYDYQILKTNTESCLEESIYRIKRSSNYTGQFEISMETFSCTVTIENKIGSDGIKIIRIESRDNNGINIDITKELNSNTDPFELRSI